MKRVKYTCGLCGTKDLKRSQMDLDHVIPVVGEAGFNNWEDFINNLFCDEANLLLICKPCHLVKTEKENNARRK